MSGPLQSRRSWLGALREGFRSSSSKSKRALLLVLAAGALPWIIALAVLKHLRHQDRDREISEALRQPNQDLAAAEQARRDPSLPRLAQERAASFALEGFRRAWILSGGLSREASRGLGRCFEILREEGLAEEHYLKAERLPAAQLGLSRIYLRRYFDADGDRDWRAEAKKRLASLPPGPPDAESEVFMAYLQARWQECMTKGLALVEQDPASDITWLAIAAAAIEAGKFDQAFPALDRAEPLHATRATLHFYRGLAYAGLGDRGRARDAFSAALQSAPPSWGHSLEAQVRLDRLGR